jgi:hypothetical protein
MVRMPPTVPTQTGKKNLEIFAASAAARELDERPDIWTVVEWSWTPAPPLRVVLRSDQGDRRDVVIDASGVWRMQREPVEPKIGPPTEYLAKT